MANFYGSFDYSVDAKGRVNVPAKYRKALSPEAEDTFIVTHGPGGCLRAYPKDAWNTRMAKFAALRATPETDKLRRIISSTSSDSALDAQGRITLTAAQMKHAQITKDVTIIGDMQGFIELWDSARYRENIGSMQDFDALIYSVEEQLAGMEQSARV
jgi:MraZ protein